MNDNTKIEGIDYQGVESYKNIGYNYKCKYNFLNNYFTGIKWECVEFIRRWYILNFNATFREIDKAIDIVDVDRFFDIKTKNSLKIIFNYDEPEIGDIVIFKVSDIYPQGHVAIVTYVDDVYFYLSEQNHIYPWKDKQYSRKFRNEHIPGEILGFLSLYKNCLPK